MEMDGMMFQNGAKQTWNFFFFSEFKILELGLELNSKFYILLQVLCTQKHSEVTDINHTSRIM